MSGYVSKEEVKSLFGGCVAEEYPSICKAVHKAIDCIPNADVREVVHCKDCRFYRQGTMNFPGRCNWHGGFRPDEDWFCADGERV